MKCIYDSYFCFESVDKPGLLEEFYTKNLAGVLKNKRYFKIKLVVISAYSGNLGQILVDAGIPVVICINLSC